MKTKVLLLLLGFLVFVPGHESDHSLTISDTIHPPALLTPVDDAMPLLAPNSSESDSAESFIIQAHHTVETDSR